ncbi:MAG TPA: leucyl/phenylalanyl-tRNA--protein transferase [Herpetosiphon sp.]|uniref:Leucyl/phenylalanyl-tRNA--protein transferase n=1 Tax=Herpetosiphon aurantiacus (strain ATCC 23779 / DSM 785 / 114-95) TaxID=316274 RepID=LFTR_HERA2|nr:leucyl/phenylalanyl-tRNA--protein transferase [Herpetosiphon sp.]A9B6X1.1 RecName: Full=Leucyl/phenylalanyl-tRNA--protein transferase; AltName: Full=L/F-transferase; AltName: Full=Leucyltransferase; AltName: Full=Phenyalanyltransferase [Herpetosiphon aurantiacus DSM 785]ABX05839.1 Leucyltransferase [Herpetosiphon aurantiacus DSM 785]HBW48766.1 leucyl/phenylalanyl-tRNA--protein transferase [Herpetosiphon sp.]
MTKRLSPQLLIYGYAQGIFPMDEDGQIYWYDPDPRAIIPLDERFHVSSSLQRTIRRQTFEIRFDTAFRETMQACSERDETWISQEFIEIYSQLHAGGLAHSVEAWQDGEMVGGLYGVGLAGLFAGESMWSKARDASKVALVALVERLRAGGFQLLDTQFITPHLATFGAYEIPRAEYKQLLVKALQCSATF